LNFAQQPISKVSSVNSTYGGLMMRRLLVAATLAATLSFGGLAASVAFADSDPTMDQIYAAAAGGHLDQAQQMITQVLADHPTSAKAHFVQAELYAREGKSTLARSELGTAEQLKPGLPFASARSVQELRAQLGVREGTTATTIRTVPATPRFPWGTVLILAAVVGLLLMVFRRRNSPGQYPAAGPGMSGAPGTYGPGGYGPGPMGGGGIGSGIAGGLASGLAVGAGVVAGEELAHHFLDGGRGGGVIPPAEAGESGGNSDMGGSDFGVNDPGSGWDDGGGSDGGGGGGDWS
jgi:uncharacterized protein